jgi:MOSC domain-containing protein YiiM
MPEIHRVLRLWIRQSPGGPMAPREALDAVAGSGIVGDHTHGRLRHVTLVFQDDWNAAAATLGLAVDPAGRRANVLLSGGGGSELVGRRVRIGDVVVDVQGITSPCPVMDKAAPGMQAALRPDGRAGVWGRIVTGGTLRPGDALAIEDDGASGEGPGR